MLYGEPQPDRQGLPKSRHELQQTLINKSESIASQSHPSQHGSPSQTPSFLAHRYDTLLALLKEIKPRAAEILQCSLLSAGDFYHLYSIRLAHSQFDRFRPRMSGSKWERGTTRKKARGSVATPRCYPPAERACVGQLCEEPR
jgi:hypothetical protein